LEEDEEEILKERKKKVIVSLVATATESLWYAKLSSSFNKTLRIIAWMKRYIRNKFNRQPIIYEKELSIFEIESAEKSLIKLLQSEVFPNKGEIISGLRVNRGEDGIIRVNTKLLNREDTVGFRQPILLPNSHPLVEMIVNQAHLDYGHSGVQFLMGKLREKYWILQGRRTIKSILSKCVLCKRFSCKKQNVIPSPLPQDRVRTGNAFAVTGVDLAGPLFLKNKEKVWIVLFTCAVYRCVSLELVQSLSTEDFLDAFSRFSDRRGRPCTVYSDNGTNFVGAVNLYKEIDWDKVNRETTMKRIDWRFNPPSAAWWGGWWERLVRTIKDLLKRILGRARVTYVKLSTYLCSIEAYVNGRPLTTVTEDIDDLTPLTPAMFLHELPTPEVSELDYLTAGLLREHVRNRKTLLDEFKMRFRKEYLSQLVQRGKAEKCRNFQIGEVVLVGDDNKKRWQWPLAKIIELFPGKDGNVRVAKVKTAAGKLVRPLQRLFPLEVSSAAEIQAKPDNEDGISDKEKVNIKKSADYGKDKEFSVVKTRSGRSIKTPDRFGS